MMVLACYKAGPSSSKHKLGSNPCHDHGADGSAPGECNPTHKRVIVLVTDIVLSISVETCCRTA